MTMRQFIREHKDVIDNYIEAQVGKESMNHYGRNNHQRELWINNDAQLYNFARRKGVKFLD